VYVYSYAGPAFAYYAPVYGLGDVKFETFYSRKTDDASLATTLLPLRGGRRTWVVLAHVYIGAGRVNKADIYLQPSIAWGKRRTTSPPRRGPVSLRFQQSAGMTLRSSATASADSRRSAPDPVFSGQFDRALEPVEPGLQGIEPVQVAAEQEIPAFGQIALCGPARHRPRRIGETLQVPLQQHAEIGKTVGQRRIGLHGPHPLW